jgi:uncharacterized membrane protein
VHSSAGAVSRSTTVCVQHKVLGLHQIRYNVDLTPYDLIWNISGGIGLIIGIIMLFGPARSTGEP